MQGKNTNFDSTKIEQNKAIIDYAIEHVNERNMKLKILN